MSDHAADALQWAADHGLQVSVNKSNCTLFTSDTHQSRLDPSVSCNGNTFPLCQSPKLLGVTFDTHFTFSPHIRGVAERARSRLGILKALAGVSLGQSKEVLLLTYQMLIKPILSCAAPVWFPTPPPLLSLPCSPFKTQPFNSHWLPLTISIRRPQYSLFAPICPCYAPCSSSVWSDRTLPPTRPSPRTQALATSGTPCSPASDLCSPPTSSMASRNPTPTASPFSGCTRTLLNNHWLFKVSPIQ